MVIRTFNVLHMMTLTLIFMSASSVNCSFKKQQLIKNLTSNYNVDVRPVLNESTVVTLTVDVALNQIINLDEKNQILRTMVWMRCYWFDEYLTWNPDDYDGITNIRLQPKSVWTPDITLYNDVSEIGMTPMNEYNVKYNSDGHASWLAPVPLTSACKLDMSNFPHDRQLCTLTFGSWAFHGHELDLRNKSNAGDNSSFVSSGEWFVDGIPARRLVTVYGCCPEPYPTLTFTLIMRRRPLFYIFNLLLPCVVIIAITAMGFLLPAESGEKVSLMITCLLSLTVFLLLVAETMPPNSESVPLLGIFFAASIILVALSTVICVLILQAHHHGSHGRQVPYVLKKIVFSGMARIVFQRKLVLDMELENAEAHAVIEQDILSWINRVKPNKEGTKSQNSNGVPTGVCGEMLKGIREIKSILQTKHNHECNSHQWQILAIILDQLFFYVFTLITLGMAIYIFTSSPSYDEVP